MAANTGVIDGNDLIIEVNGEAIAHATTHSLEPTAETRERLSKDTGKWKGRVPSLLDWKASCEALACYDGNSYHTLFALMIARTPVTLKLSGRPAVDANDNWKPEAIGDTYYEGLAIITGLPLTAPLNGDATFSCSFEAAGALVPKTVAA